VPPVLGHEQQVGLYDEPTLVIENDIHRRDGDASEPARICVIGQQPCNLENDRLVRIEGRRRLADHTHRELANAVRFFRVVQVFLGRHRAVLRKTTMSSSPISVKSGYAN
jgi:hypothetical protein